MNTHERKIFGSGLLFLLKPGATCHKTSRESSLDNVYVKNIGHKQLPSEETENVLVGKENWLAESVEKRKKKEANKLCLLING
jgi:hypothetical protein